MKIAILSVTSSGRELAPELKNILIEDPLVIQVDTFHKKVKHNLKETFSSYDYIVGIMATGIMIRSICPLLKSKTTDPGILVMDEKAEHVISLLSGHLGGANDLTLKIASLIGARAVITTSTDINQKIGIDTLASRYFWEIENPELIVDFNQSLLNGEKIGLFSNTCICYIFDNPKVGGSYYLLNKKKFRDHNSLPIKYNQIGAIISDKIIYMTPKKVVVGLGSRKGVTQYQVLQAIKDTLENLKLPLNRVDLIATGEMKSNEKGIIEAASYLAVPLKIVSFNELKSFKSSQCSTSPLVESKFGIKGVCEPSALIAAGEKSKLIIKKVARYKVTVAVAISN
ncbi:MAG: cobalt-precorrin 5A hydrolase [Euryarchaeota archaeon]|nr:cobalt-precorrin 5A hydrolase [Euryarchaeota archaeon]MBU4607051.1 cobalt-precorrin 5A hydrolase [Euryarchaeota archaeon]MBV1728741.1 cobalt-precorrin 5A hydrolase [Methanobacterium sp.]MBV1754523.1 cobalt-precorrin 5A hydrolase [Methanobacterium sp.]